MIVFGFIIGYFPLIEIMALALALRVLALGLEIMALALALRI